MIEFDSFCYLQNQKTGGSMVETFLRKFCAEGIVRYEKHKAAKVRLPNKFYFISVREPLDTYFSLFKYGLDGKGELFEILKAQNLGYFYQSGVAGFAEWLEFVLEPNNAELFYPKSCTAIASQVGLVSLRFLRLACLDFEQQSARLADRSAIMNYFNAQIMVDQVLHYESLQTELLAIVNGPLRHAFIDLAAAEVWIRHSPRVNASTAREQPQLSAVLQQKLREREWFLYQTYYADNGAKAQS